MATVESTPQTDSNNNASNDNTTETVTEQNTTQEQKKWGGQAANKVILSDAQVQVESGNGGQLDPKEQQKLHALLGGGKKQQTKVVLNKKDEHITLGESDAEASHTLVFKDCHGCTINVDVMVTKIMIDGCNNCKIQFNKKIVTAMVEAYKCNDLHLESNTKIGTLQADMCKKVHAQFQSKELFTSCVWAGVHDLSLGFSDATEHSIKTGFTQMQQVHPDIHEERSQFIVRFVKDKLLSEKIIRLENGFPTTEREKKEFDARQEENMRKLAEQAGITIGRKKPEKKIKPNETCPKCDSGKKYKKCCGSNA
mmetsp:Transcript_9440/g.13010  ORF Transcript_9440/g.13010 Transcript_9440/m.13010 type:complete len:310 (-) Transcript_9440:100-1029(-)